MPLGTLFIVGLGPGSDELLTPQARQILHSASDIVGYIPYVERAAPLTQARLHPSDNRQELERARFALELATQPGRRVAVVSSGDSGVFAMASTVFEALEAGPAAWQHIEITLCPGISAMLAAASRLGAPLGHDFCVLSLSDNLKPWELVLKRLSAAVENGFVVALYNPVSRARPWQLDTAFDRVRHILMPETPVMFATAVTTPHEDVRVVPLGLARASMASMRTIILIGTHQTRTIMRPGHATPWVYTPRKDMPVL